MALIPRSRCSRRRCRCRSHGKHKRHPRRIDIPKMTGSARKNDLPVCFHRFTALPEHCSANIEPHHFDEDIDDSDDESNDCDCTNADECGCYGEGKDTSDAGDDASETSYDGPDAGWYYLLEACREDRKEERWYLRRIREDESRKEEEVRAPYEALEKAEKEGRHTPSMRSLADTLFRLRLHSTQYLDLFTPG
ncbi:hypothetical protein SODALDRAFT_359568 [Sodiomyces alkalinus F11]|uniref:Uncharacterized protein n=1 Tax=Sodiomyces alkalinus (strain CBS 110278 / VKM F-3762 / F11) TaxID=1314773 RepID=A0A3N2PVC9_SODAK|nr:hypothetical protein SODALDRAFT_359568 [Sodiomyces alkalinus F11]ROT38473.1 hypothetical protein SODALDRAFT_359568 [Sodiomyces alkalinus F11]